MKRHLNTAVAVTLMSLMTFGQLLVFAGTKEAERSNRQPAVPPKFIRRLKQDAGTKPKRPAGESSTVLSDGRFLLLGGEGAKDSLTDAEIRDAQTGAVTRLAQGLIQKRAWHTATVLPDGKVAIIGGIAAKGKLAGTVEIFDPETSTFSRAPGQIARAYHTATLLTDGRVFIAGGSDEQGSLLGNVEFWNEGKSSSASNARLQNARIRGTASLQSDGRVLISAGADESGAAISSAEIYFPENDSLTWIPAPPAESETAAPRLVFSSPADGTFGVDPNLRIALRFSKALRPDTINRTTVRLAGPTGEVPARVVAAEAGRLAFVTPLAALASDSTYHVSIDGASNVDGQKLAFTSIAFKTEPDDNCRRQGLCGVGAQIIDADSWIPGPQNFKTDWKSGRANSMESLPALQAASGETALAGQVRALSGNPLANVTLQIGNRTAVTDHTGRFLLTSLPAGRHQLTIQGHTAGKPGKRYGTFDVLVDITAGKTIALPYTIWLPVLDDQNAVPLPVPTDREIGVTTPRVPGMEVRVPRDSVLRMPAGAHHSHGLKRQELTSMSITPIPADRTPFPLPAGVTDALVFTLQLHGAKIEGPQGEKRPGFRIVYPNYLNLPAGDRVEFWNYDPSGPGWYKYGEGTVTADRRQVIPDAGVELQSMHCISLMFKSFVAWVSPAMSLLMAFFDGDPVDLSTGLFVYRKTDLILPDVIPVELSRTYRQNDSNARSFGKGFTHPYDMFIYGDTANYGEIILPDGARIHFDKIPNSSPWVYECTRGPGPFYKATMRQITGVGPNGAWEVKLVDGTIYQFGIKVLYGDIFGIHDSINFLSVIQDRFGNKVTITRDANLRISRVTSPNGRWIEFGYIDASNRIATATDNSGRVVSYLYDASGRLWKVTDAKGGVTEYTYDSNDRMLTIKDPRNIVYLTNQYDATSGRITSQTLADNGVYQFTYTVDGNGKVTQTDVTDPRNYVRRATFNSVGFCVTDTFALGTAIQQTYTYQWQTGTNFLLSMTDPLNRTTALTYNAQGYLTSVTRPSGTPDAVTTSMTYDSQGKQVVSVTDPLNQTLAFTYDSNGMLTEVTDPLNHHATFTYNSAGQILTATNPLQQTTQFTYDSGDLVAITDSLNRTVNQYIDAAGRVTQVTNPMGDVVRSEFDSMGDATRAIDPQQGATQFAYDPNGNILSVTDARNSVTSYIYDNMDRLTTRRDPLLHDEIYEYDLNGNLTEVTDRKSQITQFTYDALNRLTQVTYADASTTSYTYDSVNRLTQVVDSVSGTITYAYDNLDRVTSETTPQGTVSYTYDAGGRCTSMTVAGQPPVSYTYDNGNRLTQITQGSSTVTIAYDDGGRRTSLTLPNGIVTEYGYDAGSQLTSLTYKQGGNVIGDVTYEYDSNGRRTRMGGSFARSIMPQPVASATYNAANQQLSFGGQTLTYDLNGNLVSDGVNTYTWDARDQLSNVTGSGTTASFQYDSRGQRVGKTLNGTTTNFLYNGANIVQEQSAQTGTANILSGGIDEIFTRTDSSGSWNPLLDGLGSSLALTDATGAAQTQYTYGAFGQSTATGADNNNAAQYTGRENDGTSLQFNRARYYSATLQRFISEDPLEFEGGDINLYAYTANSPTNFTDPSGLSVGGISGRMRSIAQRKLNYDYLLGFAAHTSAGFGDRLTSLVPWPVSEFIGTTSLTEIIRNQTPGGAVIDKNSSAYRAGGDTGNAVIMALTAGAGAGSSGGASGARTTATFDAGRTGHIFRQSPGHVTPGTAASQGRFARLFERVASNPKNARPDLVTPAKARSGVQVYTQTFRNGQVWVEIRNGIIQNAGVNPVGAFR
ncbi:MAG: kelch repeat-containing protein [Pyrinomonadaceae bacterium]